MPQLLVWAVEDSKICSLMLDLLIFQATLTILGVEIRLVSLSHGRQATLSMSETITRDVCATYTDKVQQTVQLTLIQLLHQIQTQSQIPMTLMMTSSMISESSVQTQQMVCVDKTVQQDASGLGQPLMQMDVCLKMPLADVSQHH